MKNLQNLLLEHINEKINSLKDLDKLQEIRLKIEKPIIVNIGNKEYILNYIITREDIKKVLQRMSNYSIYAFEEEFKQGYITIKGGHRVGISGECVFDKGKIKTIKNIYSLNIRVAREIKGCGNKIIFNIANKDKIYNTLIISPPKCGKTTLIRDLARLISNGNYGSNISGKKVSIVDERSEIAACYHGVPQMDVGIRSDVYDNCIKSEGIMMAIRSLSPEVIICDEIGSVRDIEAVISAFNSGVKLITTIHGNNIKDIYNRKILKELIENKILEKVIVLSNSKGIGTVESIYDLTKEGEYND
ncbi:stage III sporulation protein AA [Clostridium fallax]|uniref:Stage III sporulation protein AA n=1 Tax=Clostridium fallax TaxID=1533 RepID=A0A1M4XMQ3_9CLOT|nr:stage III sporulation protein AA [Clostridium fallax]SHE94887.1 stage III sporulation protein AA [Clostridium fallax]SQB06337.1 stage III sporulation protein AA [Clostridium fallax]